jgi:hypothetical protein
LAKGFGDDDSPCRVDGSFHGMNHGRKMVSRQPAVLTFESHGNGVKVLSHGRPYLRCRRPPHADALGRHGRHCVAIVSRGVRRMRRTGVQGSNA